MADRKHLLHVKSNVAETTDQYGIKDFSVTPKKPNTDDMLFGEIAVNYGKGVEALTIKNSENEIISFINENDFNEANEIIANGIAKEKSERVEAFNSFKESSVAKMVSITYSELKSLKVSSRLKAGQFYRITDYVTTTTQEDTQSAGHAFDVIVIATDVDTLNENAKAIKHEGDTYFADSNLDAWEIKYDLDNDTTKYTWADETNGKGVIYYMKDEWNNECPYDFKNIQFMVGAKQQAGTLANVFYFTFSVATGTDDATVTDHSLNGAYCYENKIGLYISSNKRSLNANVFRDTSATSICDSNIFGNNCYSNTFGNTCCCNTFGNNCYSNTFGSDCYSNTFGNTCYINTFGSLCSDNTFGSDCYSNTFGSFCSHNTFGDVCRSNTFGNTCYSNTFGSDCDSNTFGSNCYSNTFGSDCSDNTFGNTCYSNIFGNTCDSNTFGSLCSYNTFGNSCRSNTFGNSCRSNTFGSDCDNNTFGTASAAKSHYDNIIFENGVQHVLLDCAQTTSYLALCQNVLVGMGIAGKPSSKKTLTVATAGNTFKTMFKTANDVEVTA